MPVGNVLRLTRWLAIAAALIAGIAAAPARATEANTATIELRQTVPFARPYDAPSLCALFSLPLTEHWWAGGGYELIQDYDVILWTAKDTGHKPIVMSGLRVGAWYRGGTARRGFTWAAGGLLTFANTAFSLARSPAELDGDTYVVDLGGDFSVGHVWQGIRVEGFLTPAWSYGRVVSSAMAQDDRLSTFTYRFGVALAILLGS